MQRETKHSACKVLSLSICKVKTTFCATMCPCLSAACPANNNALRSSSELTMEFIKSIPARNVSKSYVSTQRESTAVVSSVVAQTNCKLPETLIIRANNGSLNIESIKNVFEATSRAVRIKTCSCQAVSKLLATLAAGYENHRTTVTWNTVWREGFMVGSGGREKRRFKDVSMHKTAIK